MWTLQELCLVSDELSGCATVVHKPQREGMAQEQKKDRHLLVLPPLTLVGFFLRRLKEESVCAHAHPKPYQCQTTLTGQQSQHYKVPAEFH